MATTAGSSEGGAQARLEGALSLMNVLIGIRLRSVTDPDSRRHLIWLNDVVAGLGLWNRRTASGRSIDFGDYLDAAVAFWGRVAQNCRVSIDRPSQPVVVPDVTAAALSIIAHELLGAAVARVRPDDGDCMVTLSLEVDAGGLRLGVTDHGPGWQAGATNENLDLVRGLAEHLGGSLFLSATPAGTTTVVLPPQGGGFRH